MNRPTSAVRSVDAQGRLWKGSDVPDRLGELRRNGVGHVALTDLGFEFGLCGGENCDGGRQNLRNGSKSVAPSPDRAAQARENAGFSFVLVKGVERSAA